MQIPPSRAARFSAFRWIVSVYVLASVLVFPPRALALPEGGQVVAGEVSFAGGTGQLDLTQTGNAAIVNWADFSIAANEIVNIHQAVDAAMLNRVMGANPSELLGQLNADGRVYLVNPNGVLVGADARIDAGGFFATTAQIGDAAFLAGGDLSFTDGSGAAIVNLGVIQATDGDAVLVAYRVVNEGEVHAANGTAALTAATQFVYATTGDTRITVASSAALTDGGVGVDNAGLIDAADAELTAADGNLFALAVNQTGVVRATGVDRTGGRVLLTADQGVVSMEGEISAHRDDGSGGEVLVGGDFHGDNPAVANAGFTYVGDEALIDVGARSVTGNGGTAVVWADDHAIYRGFIDGRAGQQGGDGGNVEVSGKVQLDFRGHVDLSSATGAAGHLLLDPGAITVQAGSTDAFLDSDGGGASPVRIFQENIAAPSILTVDSLVTLLNTGVNVTLDTSGAFIDGVFDHVGIDVLSPVAWNTGSTLIFKSGDVININADLTGGAGSAIVFGLGSNSSAGLGKTTGVFTVHEDATVSADQVTIQPNVDARPLNAGITGAVSTGAITFNGILITDTLDLAMPGGGFGDDVTIANPANQIGTLTSSNATGGLTGTLTVVDGTGDITVTGSLTGIDDDVTISTSGDLTLGSGASIGTAGGGDIFLAAGGSFTNEAGSSALSVSGDGRFLIYSDNPTDTTLGGLGVEPVYNKTFAGNAPVSMDSYAGNRVLYSLAPTLTFTATDQTRAYGDDNAVLGFTVSGLLAGDTAAEAYSGDPALETTITSATDVGTYTDAITIAAGSVVASDYDYGIAFAPGDFTVDPAVLSVTVADATRLYGDTNPSFSGTITGFKLDQDASVLTTAPTYVTSAHAGVDVGSYDIIGSGAQAANYTFTYSPGNLRVDPSPLLVTAANTIRLYGDANPGFSGTITGFKLGQDASDLSTAPSYVTVADAGSNVGDYTVIGTGAAATNYSFAYAPGTLTINPAPLTITANDQSRDYGDANPLFGVAYSGFKNSDDATVVTGLSVTTAATEESDVGDYAIVPAGATATNYTITEVEGTLTVDPAAITVTADDASRTYGAINPTFTGEVTGLKLGQDASVLTGLGYHTAATAGSDVGDYGIVASGSTNLNYTTTYEPGTLTVTPAPLTITAQNAAARFNEPIPEFSALFIGLIEGDIAADISGLTLTTGAVQGSDVGDYDIIAANATNPNYTISFQPGTLTISNQILTITADSFTRLYGAANPTFTATTTGFVDDDDISIFTAPVTFTTLASEVSGVGTYVITPGGATAPNYDITFVQGTLTVDPALLTITANDQSCDYGDINPTLDVTYSGFRNDDDATVVSGLTVATDATADSDVGTYDVVPTGASATNYTITHQDGTLTIEPAAITVTADDTSRAYGATNPTFTGEVTGLKLGQDASVLTNLGYSTAATSASDVGDYDITPGGSDNPNYTATYTPGTLSVDPAPLTIAANNAAARYHEPIPDFSASFVGLVNGDTAADISDLTLTTTAAQGSDVGSYAIIAANATSANYAISFQPGLLTISEQILTITADSFTRLYGAANPTFTATTTGFADDDDFSILTDPIVFTTAATQNSAVGTYAIVPSGATAPNYDIIFVPGTLSIDPALLTITATDFSRTYGDANPTFTADIDGLVAADTAADITGLVLSSDATLASGTGDYAITPSGASNANYAITFVEGTLSVEAAALTVTLDDVSRDYGDANPTLTSTITGFKLNDDASLLTGLAPATAAVAESAVGDYAISTGDVTAANYTVAVHDGTLTVEPAVLTVSADDQTREYGDANGGFTATTTGFKLDDDASILSGLTFLTTATAASDVGGYPIIPFGGSADNYTLSFVPGELIINPAPLLIAADSQSRLYGQSNPTFTATFTGLKSVDEVANFTDLILSTTAVPASNVGRYDIFISGVTNDNYNLTLQHGVLTVEQAPLTITANDFTRTYGDLNPIFTATFDGLASFDTEDAVSGLAFTTAATRESDVQDVAITVGGATSNNYALTYVPGTLTIAPALLDFTAAQFTRVYGDTEVQPIDAAAVTGYKLDDTFTDLGASVLGLDPTADVGSYDVQLELSNANYAVGSAPSLLTVQAAPLQVQVGDLMRVYGEQNPDLASLALTVEGLVFDHTAEDVLNLAFPVGPTADVGNYDLVPELLSANYVFTDLDVGNLAVVPRHIALKPANTVRYYGDENPAYQILVAGDGLASFDTVAAVASPVAPVPADATADMSATGLHGVYADLTGNPNYRVENLPGLFTVLPRPITITVDTLYAVINAALPTFNVTADNLAPGDTLANAFPDIEVGVYDQNQAASVEIATTLTTFSAPAEFDDAAFLASHPTTIQNPTPGSGNQMVSVPVPEVILVDTLDGGESPRLTITHSGQFFWSDSVLTPEEQASLQDQIRWLQPEGYLGANPNYAVTVVHNGQLILSPDPVRVAELERLQEERLAVLAAEAAVAAEEAAFQADKAAFLNPGGSLQAAFGMPVEALPVMLDAIRDQLRKEVMQQIFLEGMGEAGEAVMDEAVAVGPAIRAQLGLSDDEEITERHIYAFLADLHSNLEKQALLVPTFTEQVLSLAGKSAANYTPAEAALAASLERRMTNSRDQIVVKMEQNRVDYEVGKDTGILSAGFQPLFGGDDVPWSEFMSEAAGAVVEEQMASQITSSLVASGTGSTAGIASGMAIGAFAKTVFPFLGAKIMGLPATAGTSLALGATGPAAVIAVAITVGIVRGVEVFENNDQRVAFENLAASRGQPLSLGAMDLTLDPESKDLSPILSRTILLTALSGMMTGG